MRPRMPELFGASRPTTSPTPIPRSCQRAGEGVDAGHHVAIGRLGAGHRVDQRDSVGVGIGEVTEEVVVDTGS